jgi:hypothetical protein
MQLVFYSMIQFPMQLRKSNGGCPPLREERGWGEAAHEKTPAMKAGAVL